MIDRNDAPEGCIAVKWDKNCNRCEENSKCQLGESHHWCGSKGRQDNQSVRFIRRPTIILNTTGNPPKVPGWGTEYRIHTRTSRTKISASCWTRIEYMPLSHLIYDKLQIELSPCILGGIIATEFR